MEHFKSIESGMAVLRQHPDEEVNAVIPISAGLLVRRQLKTTLEFYSHLYSVTLTIKESKGIFSSMLYVTLDGKVPDVIKVLEQVLALK